ncbi:MAG: ABC transporter permease [Fimbriimonadaceae bacterium]|nr:ABC transporter permease [Fimbriimonadaceae bacterium]
MKQKHKFDFLFWIGAIFLLALVVFCFVYPYIGPPVAKRVADPFLGAGGKHLLGTDEQGFDILVRIAHGGRTSLLIGFVVQSISVFFGVFLGAAGVFAPKWLRVPVLRFIDGMFAFPDILLAIMIIGFWGPGVLPVVIALSITSWPAVARLVVAQVASLKDREFVVAAQAQGASTTYTVVKHILPQMGGILLAYTMVSLAGTILSESTLSFIGIGIQAPQPSWGGMIEAARQQMSSYPLMLLWPCAFLSATIFALNFVGDGLRSTLDPRSK